MEHFAKSEGMVCPISLWRGRGYLLNTPPQSKHDPSMPPQVLPPDRGAPLGAWHSPSRVRLPPGPRIRRQEPAIAVNSRSRPCILAYCHLLHPAIEPAPLDVHNLNTKLFLRRRKPSVRGPPDGGSLTDAELLVGHAFSGPWGGPEATQSRPVLRRFECVFNLYSLSSAPC
jgi:hypothetical protein